MSDETKMKPGDAPLFVRVDDVIVSGLTVRDWFAGQALAGIMAAQNNAVSSEATVFTAQTHGCKIQDVSATIAYEHADAMLRARDAKRDD